MTQGLSFRQGFVRSRVAAVSLVAAALGVLVAGGASAFGSLTIVPDATTYTVGDTITLDIVFSWGELSETEYAALELSGAGGATMLSAVQQPGSACLGGTYGPKCTWSSNVLLPLNLATLDVINQTGSCYIDCYGKTFPNPVSVATFSADSPGHVVFGWGTVSFSGREYYGALPTTSTATIEILPVPEPGTATLVGMGLASLSVWGRKRRVG